VVLSSGAVGCTVWATAIDWASIQFKAADPVVLVHGIRSNGGAFANFQAGLENHYVISDNSISMTDQPAPDLIPAGCPNIPYNNSIDYNVTQLRAEIKRIAEEYGVETINIVAHSKGGIDSRAFLDGTISSPLPVQVGMMGGQPVIQDLEANSIVTLNTPHRGSVLADYGIEVRQLTWIQALRAGINTSAAKGFEGSYYCDLSTARANQAITNTQLPNGVQAASVATDADFNDNGIIGIQENDGFPLDDYLIGLWGVNTLYQLVGGTAGVSITVTEVNSRPDTITVTENPTATFLPNDAIVTVNSANEYITYGIDDAHHINVHSQANAETIAQDSQAPGLVDWRTQ
jgi:triacylglycerol esterase/lipase EstA (alpha/beta hydrolase family)